MEKLKMDYKYCQKQQLEEFHPLYIRLSIFSLGDPRTFQISG